MADPLDREWLLFTAQLPAAPSSARVAVWRRLKAIGAASLPAGTWVLPRTDDHSAALNELVDTVQRQGGSAALFRGHTVGGLTSDQIVDRFRSDRAREFNEFDARVADFLAELDKETQGEKFTFAELEEIEDDLAKLTAWLAKIRNRDFFPDHRRNTAAAILARCEEASRAFAATVYAREVAEWSP